MNRLIEIDWQLLLAVNNFHAAWADQLMWIVSAKFTWIPLYVVLVGCVLYKWRKPISKWPGLFGKIPAWIWILLMFGLAVGMSDFISSGIIKHTVCRLRPTHEPALEGMLHIVNGYVGGKYGFVSSHAANTMACALLFSSIWKNRKATIPLMVWVALNCYSRMYLGVHYPGDILGGLIVGATLSVVAYVALRRLGVVDDPKVECQE